MSTRSWYLSRFPAHHFLEPAHREVWICIVTYIKQYTCIHCIYVYVHSYSPVPLCTYWVFTSRTVEARSLALHFPRGRTANLCTKILDFRGFDSSSILKLRGGMLTSIGHLSEILSQRILVGIISLGIGRNSCHAQLQHGIRVSPGTDPEHLGQAAKQTAEPNLSRVPPEPGPWSQSCIGIFVVEMGYVGLRKGGWYGWKSSSSSNL